MATATQAGVDSSAAKVLTRQEVAAFLSEIAKKVLESNTNYFQSMLALNHLLRLPNAAEVFDKDLKDQARDLWLKVKSSGFQLNDPPFLFGDSKLPFEDGEDETPKSTPSEQRERGASKETSVNP